MEDILTEKQLMKLWEENLNMRFWYHYDEIKNEKRPFGNSGISQIFKDIKDLLKIDKKFEVENEDELDEKIYNYTQNIFNQMIDFTKCSDENYGIKIIRKNTETVQSTHPEVKL